MSSSPNLGPNDNPDEYPPEPPRLRLLRQLVTTLTVVLIVGVIAVVILLVIRLNSVSAPQAFPTEITAPAGETVRAATMGTSWTAIVTQDSAGAERIHILRPDGTIRQTVEITPE